MFDIPNSNIKFQKLILHVNLFQSLMINPSLCLFRKACLGSCVKFWLKLKWLQSNASSSYSKSYCCAFDPEPNYLQRSFSHWKSSIVSATIFFSWLKLLLVGLSRWLGAHRAHTSAINHPYLTPSFFIPEVKWDKTMMTTFALDLRA